MLKEFFIAGATIGCCLANIQAHSQSSATDLTLFTTASTLTYSQNLAIDGWLDNFHAPNPTAGEYTLTHNEIATGVAWRGFSIAAFARRDYFFHYSNDVFTLVYLDKNHQKFPSNADYQVALDIQHIYITGTEFAYEYAATPSLSGKITLAYFTAQDLLFGEINGYLQNSGKRAAGDLLLDYNYTKDVVLRRPLTPPGRGEGESLSLELHWQPLAALTLDLSLADLYGVIHWRQAPFTRVTISTVRTYVDSDGNTHRSPNLSGTQYFRDIDQELPQRNKLRLGYRFNSGWELAAEDESYADLHFPRLAAHYHWGQDWDLGLGYDLEAEAPHIELGSPYVKLMLSADTSDAKQARLLAGSLGLQVSF